MSRNNLLRSIVVYAKEEKCPLAFTFQTRDKFKKYVKKRKLQKEASAELLWRRM